MGLSSVFDLAARALRAQDVVLQTTGHNIANVDRPGYSRQEAVLVSEDAQRLRGTIVGSGVAVDYVRQEVDALVEAQLLRARSSSAEASAARDELARLESIFGDVSGSGLQDALDAFFASADDLALHPQGMAERTALLARAETLATRFSDRAAELAELQRQLDEGVTAAVAEVNGLVDEIARLNNEIYSAEIGEHHANDLRDQRREALGELSELIGITQFETDGQVTVIGPDGWPLVYRDGATHLVADTTTAPTLTGLDGRALSQLGFEVGNGDFVAFSDPVEGGKLGGLLRVRDTDIPSIAGRLDQLAASLAAAVNAVHTSGEDLDGNAGGAVFGGTAASSLTVLITDPRQVAASAATTPPALPTPEDNQNALALAAVSSAALDGTDPALGSADLGGATLVGFLASTIAAAGTLSQTATDSADAADSVTVQLEARRAEISGVSTNEELIKLLDAQRAFQAAAVLVNTATAALDSLLEMVQ